MTGLAEHDTLATAIARRFNDFAAKTERAEKEAAWQREALGLCPVPVILISAKGYAVYTNDAWDKMLGCTYGDCLSDNWKSYLHPDDRAEVSHLVDTAIQSAMSGYRGEHRFLTRKNVTVTVYCKMDRTSSGDYIMFCAPIKSGCAAVCLKNGGHDRTRTG